jgi:hypothetical protein
MSQFDCAEFYRHWAFVKISIPRPSRPSRGLMLTAVEIVSLLPSTFPNLI